MKVAKYILLIFIISCKKDIPQTSSEAIIAVSTDTVTKYTSFSEVKLTKALGFNISPETLKIINLNGQYYLITSYGDMYNPTYDYIRSYKIDTLTGSLNENTESFLGGYEKVGFAKGPFFYEDLNGDGIKDIFIVDHGKEIPTTIVNGQFPGYFNHLYYGNANGTFNNAKVIGLTDIQRFYHNASIGDINGDGKKDIVVQSFTNNDELLYFTNANNTLNLNKILTLGNQTGSVYVGDIDNDNVTDIISAPYIDRGNVPSSYVLKININGSDFSKTKISNVSPFNLNYGCYKIMGLKNPKNKNITNLFYFVESGVQNQKIFKTSDNDIATLNDIDNIQKTYHNDGTRDFIIMDLNFDGIDDVFFLSNPGANLNQRIWINNGDNTFHNSNWNVDNLYNQNFIPLTTNPITGKIKFLYYADSNTPTSKIIEVYTK